MLSQTTGAGGPPAGHVVSSRNPLAVGRNQSGLLSGTVAGVIVIESLYVLWTASRGYFFQDDFLDLALARQLGFNGRLLEQPIFGHFVPGYNAVNYLVSFRTPYQWPIIETADVLLFALSLFLLHRLLVTLFGPTWVGVILVALASASFSFVPSVVWWASGLQQLVAIPAVLLAVLCHVHYLSTGRVRHAVCGGLALAIGLAFYDGTLVGVLFIVLMTLLFWPAGPGLRGALRTVVVNWRAWLCYGVPVAFDLVWRFSHNALYATPPLPHPGDAIQFISLSWTQTFVPLAFGLDTWLLPSHLDRLIAGVVGQIGLVVFVVWTIYRRRVAGRAWAMFGVTFLASTSLVGLTRVSMFGPGDASDVRYVTLAVYLFVISVGLALMPLQERLDDTKSIAVPMGSRERAKIPRHAAIAGRRVRSAIIVIPVVCIAIVVYGTLLIFDQRHDLVVQEDLGSHQFFSKFAASWPPVGSTHPFLWDSEVDPVVVSGAFYPYDTAAFTVGKLNPKVRFDSWGGEGYLLRPDGSVVRAVPATWATGILPASGVCVAAGAKPASIPVVLNHAVKRQQTFGVISYQSTTGAVATESGGATVRFPKGSGTLLTSFPPVALPSVEWVIPPQKHLCVTAFRIVIPEPSEGN